MVFKELGRSLAGFAAGIVLVGTGLLGMDSTWAQDDTSMPSIPDHFQQRGMNSGKAYENQAPNEIIDPFSGRLQYHFTDLEIPGAGGMNLAIRRSYNSIDDPFATQATWESFEYSPVGLGWTMHMGRVLRAAGKAICSTNWSISSANPVLEMPDGNRRVLYEANEGSGDPKWITKDFWRANCQEGYLHIQSPDGTTYQMTTIGHMFGADNAKQRSFYASRIIDRNGNWFNIAYKILPRGVAAITEVTSSDGRIVKFAYTGSNLSSITDELTGRVWRYTVQQGEADHNKLSEVQRPDGLSWKFAYQASSPGKGSLQRVEYPSGGSIDYVYGTLNFHKGFLDTSMRTVLKQKIASTNTPDGLTGTWTWDYQISSEELKNLSTDGYVYYEYAVPPPNREQVNITKIIDPLGQTSEYYYMGIKSVNGSNSLVGTYLGKATPDEMELVGHTDIEISSQLEVDHLRFGMPGGHVSARVPHLVWKSRNGATHEISKRSFDAWGNPGLIEETGDNGEFQFVRKTLATYRVDTARWLLHQVASMDVTVEAPESTSETYKVVNLHSPQGNLLSETRAGVITSYTYTGEGDLATKRDAKGRVTTHSDYFRGTPRRTLEPGDVVINRSVDPAGNVTSETSGRGHATTYAFDGLNRPTQIKPPAGAPISVTYGPSTILVTRGATTDLLTSNGFQKPVSRLVKGAGALEIKRTFVNDILGRQVFASYPNSSKGVGKTWDSLNRPTGILHNTTPDLVMPDARETIRYGGMGVMHFDSQQNGKYVRNRSFGDPNEQQSYLSISGRVDGNTIYGDLRADMKRNAMGQLTEVRMGDVVRTYKYDSNYYLTASTEPETGVTTYSRDEVGNMTKKSLGTLTGITYEYDDRNRVIRVVYPESETGSIAKADEVTSTYDANDQLKSVSAGGIERAYSYDENNKLLTESLKLDGRAFAFTYAYDANEALSSITYPSNRVISFKPDAYGRAKAAAPYVTDVSYHPNGFPETVTYANGIVSSMAVNERQWPSSHRISRPNGYVLDSTFEYDAMGHVTRIGDAADSTFNREYEYDRSYRLTMEAFSDRTATAYYYNNHNDIVYIGDPVIGDVYATHIYDYATKRLTNVNLSNGISRSYGYDTAGNVARDGLNQFGYDRANQMRCVQCGVLGVEVKYSYDGAGLRVKTNSADGQITYSVYAKDGLLMMVEKPGIDRREYIYLGRRQVAEHRTRLN